MSIRLCATRWERLHLPARAAEGCSGLPCTAFLSCTFHLPAGPRTRPALLFLLSLPLGFCSLQTDLRVIHSCFPLPTPQDRHAGGHSSRLGDILGSSSLAYLLTPGTVSKKFPKLGFYVCGDQIFLCIPVLPSLPWPPMTPVGSHS